VSSRRRSWPTELRRRRKLIDPLTAPDGGILAQAHEPELRDEIAEEQAYVDAAYARLDVMRAAAESVRGAYSEVRAGGTHQARLERDIAYEVTARRLAELDIGEAPLLFGRLDLEPGPSDPASWYIGRLAVDDAEHNPLVIDWRAPIAEPFYRATAVEPMHVVRRRHFITRGGRTITALDDEVFDADASREAGFTVTGEGALLAALDRHRTGRMGDIVATIQAEQDEAIRAELPGVLVVSGGPGTGKTAVALHRAAYLLYTHRRHLASRGVLLVGPSPVFLRYIEQVLPSLGEQDVQLTTIAGLKPHLRARPFEPPEVAAVKGSGRMARIIKRAMADRERVLAHDVAFMMDGLRVRFSREDSARVVRGAQRQRGTHNERRPYVTRRTSDILVGAYKLAATRAYERRRLDAEALEGADAGASAGAEHNATVDSLIGRAIARGDTLPEGFEPELAQRLRRRPEVIEALERMWPVLSGAELVHDLFGFRALVRSAASGPHGLTEREQELLHRARSADVTDVEWTEADVALVDEADALVGPVEAALPRKRRRRSADPDALSVGQRVIEDLDLGAFVNAADLAVRYGDSSGDGDAPGELRTFGHVLVDEAQDLTPMQWRMLGRRCPAASFTIVGDLGQASRPGAADSWDDILEELPQRRIPPRFATLSVNYRTPAEVMDVAARLLAVAAPTVEPSRSVRRTDEAPLIVGVAGDDLVTRAASLARDAHTRGGTVAVIAPRELHAAIVAALADVGAESSGAAAIDAAVAVVDATDSKGLEFDHVIVVEPAALVSSDRAGLRLLYVTITRATKTLAIVHAQPLPEALA
jgi:DNA helicase IV